MNRETTLLIKARCRVNIFRKVLRDPSEAPGRFREAFGVRTRPRVAFWGMAPAQKRCGDASHSQSAARETWFEARNRMPSKAGNSRVLASPIASNFSPANYGLGRGCGVGRDLGAGIGLGVGVGGGGVGVPNGGVGVGVGVAVGVALGVVVGVGVAVGVAVAVGVGVGEPPQTAAKISTRPQP